MRVPLEVSAAELRLSVFSSFKNLSGRKVGVLLTGDVPSTALYLASLDAGCDPTAVLYRPRGRMVDSYRRSKDVIRFFAPPNGAECLDVEYFNHETPYEAIGHAARHRGFAAFASTHGVEGHFAIAPEFKAYRGPRELFDAFRVSYFEYKKDASGGLRFRRTLQKFRVDDLRLPFLSSSMRDISRRYSWSLLNRPRPYELIRLAFPEVDGSGL